MKRCHLFHLGGKPSKSIQYGHLAFRIQKALVFMLPVNVHKSAPQLGKALHSDHRIVYIGPAAACGRYCAPDEHTIGGRDAKPFQNRIVTVVEKDFHHGL